MQLFSKLLNIVIFSKSENGKISQAVVLSQN